MNKGHEDSDRYVFSGDGLLSDRNLWRQIADQLGLSLTEILLLALVQVSQNLVAAYNKSTRIGEKQLLRWETEIANANNFRQRFLDHLDEEEPWKDEP